MAGSKLVHLKPTLWRAYKRSVRRYDRLAERFVAGDCADKVLHRRVDYARDAMLDLASKCQAIECAIECALERGSDQEEQVPDFSLIEWQE